MGEEGGIKGGGSGGRGAHPLAFVPLVGQVFHRLPDLCHVTRARHVRPETTTPFERGQSARASERWPSEGLGAERGLVQQSRAERPLRPSSAWRLRAVSSYPQPIWGACPFGKGADLHILEPKTEPSLGQRVKNLCVSGGDGVKWRGPRVGVAGGDRTFGRLA